MKVNVLYLAKAKFGGWPTFTKHLKDALKRAGMDPVLRVHGARMAPVDFGHGLRALRMPHEAMKRTKEPMLIAAADKKHAGIAQDLVLNHGAKIVVHDPAEKHLARIPGSSVIVIRRTMHAKVPGSTFIPHPYTRFYGGEHQPGKDKKYEAISQSRVDFDKYTHHILEANDLGSRIKVFGSANPMYVYFKLRERWPKFKAEEFPRQAHAGAKLCAEASAVVDMSAIKGDGGGSQYSFLEAWDAEAPLVINRKWLDNLPPDEMRVNGNCLAAADGMELFAILEALKRDTGLRNNLIHGGLLSLADHEPKMIGERYAALLD